MECPCGQKSIIMENKENNMKKLGIIGAMDIEVAILKEQLTDPKVTHKAGSDFCEGTLRGLPVVIVRCGVGKVNAALCVQILVDLFSVTHIVNTGIAGSMDNDLDIGDLVVATEAMYHDMSVAVFGYPRGQVPGMDVRAFPADPDLRRVAAAACRVQGVKFKEGRIVSGDQFIGDSAVKDDILENCGGLCVEMESAAIAHAAYRNGIPFTILRAISDKADDSATMDYPTFEVQAARDCAAITATLAGELCDHL